MTRSLHSRLILAALLSASAVLSVTLHRPAAHADPLSDYTSKLGSHAPASLPELLGGKPYPTTLKAAQIDASFYLVDLVDTQGKPGTYSTKGETVTVGGETFLVAYFVVVDPGTPATNTIPPGSTLRLALINTHYIQAITNPRPAASAS